MASDRTEYSAMLPHLQPAQAVEVFNDRVRQVSRLNSTIADWLLERRRIEEQYAAGLRRLARSQVDDTDLGVFSIPWGSLTNSMEALAEAHAGLATKIEVDVERPLREFPSSSREMQALNSVQGNLAALAKDIDRAQQKAEKLQAKGGETNKAANASSDLVHARMEWDSQASYVFESLQVMDEARVDQLRDALTQFLTLEADKVEKSRLATEQSLNVVLNVETADEIKTYAIKTVSNAPRASVSRSQQRVSFAPPSGSSRGAGSSNNLATIPSNTDDDRVERTPSSDGKKSGLKGLKRLGTVMGRRKDKDKESKQNTSTLPSTAESPEPDRSRRFTTFGRLGRSKDSYTLEPPQEDESPAQRPRSPLRIGSEILEPPNSRQEPEPAPRLPELNGIHGHQEELANLEMPVQTPAQAPQAPVIDMPHDNEGFSVPPIHHDPISQAFADADASDVAEENLGQPSFNVNIRNAPIQEEGADVALASMANKLQAPPPTTRRSGTVRGRRDARNSAIVNNFVQPEQQESTGFTASAPEALRSAPEPIAPEIPTFAVPTPPPIQAIPEVFAPPQSIAIANAPLGIASAVQADTIRPLSRTNPVYDQMADNQSIRSGRSATTTASIGARHPDMHESGLNSSFIETVSARFDGGQLSSSSLIGEIALVYNPVDANALRYGLEIIRLENFSSLEKVALNQAFVTQSPGKEGEYSVNLSSISRPQVAFKYQLHADAASSQVPLLVTPAFRIEPNQTSVIIGYSLNPAFDMGGESSITLSNVTLALSLEGTKASTCQSKPVGTFAREKNMIFWQLGDITLTSSGPAEKLLARFATESEARSGSVESKWEISSDHVGSKLAVIAHHQNAGADPFADDDGTTAAGSWKAVPTVKRLVSGTYTAKS